LIELSVDASELSVHEVGIVLQAFDLDEFREVFRIKKIMGST